MCYNVHMQTFFIFGNHPALSAAEIIRRLGLKDSDISLISEEFLIVDKKVDGLCQLQKELGGTVKLGEICPTDDLSKILQEEQAKHSSKFNFGLSAYGKKVDPRELWDMGRELKAELKKNGSVRFVRAQKGQALSSVTTEKNGLVGGKGVEICFLHHEGQVMTGKAVAVQDFENLSRRDYGRPARDDYSGMIPPKLAQMMINISGAKKEGTVWDPFCGSGTVLQEALLMGHKKVFGSDNSPKAVADSERNIAWLKEEFGFEGKVEISEQDATSAATRADAIVTEPFLGRQRNRNAREEVKKLEALYLAALENFAKTLRKGATVAMVWPVFMEGGRKLYLFGNHAVGAQDLVPLQGMDILPPRVRDFFKGHLSKRGNLIYGRPGQGVAREIVILKKA